MTNQSEPTLRIRGLVGRNIEQLLDAKELRQQDLADLVKRSGLADWPQETVSRFIKGRRALSLEDAVVFAAALQVPLDRLLAGEDVVRIGGQPVPAAQLRDVIRTGRLQADDPEFTALATFVEHDDST